jgi:alpha-ketoglutarate-dependent taurine dioxygenase
MTSEKNSELSELTSEKNSELSEYSEWPRKKNTELSELTSEKNLEFRIKVGNYHPYSENIVRFGNYSNLALRKFPH